MVTDLQHGIQHDYCEKLTERLRELISTTDAFDVSDVVIVEVEFLILTYLALHEANLAAFYPPPDEVQGWADRFAQEFDSQDWTEDASVEKIERIRATYYNLLCKFQKVCDEHQ